MSVDFILSTLTVLCFGFALFSLGRCVEIMRNIRETNDKSIADLRSKKG